MRSAVHILAKLACVGTHFFDDIYLTSLKPQIRFRISHPCHPITTLSDAVFTRRVRDDEPLIRVSTRSTCGTRLGAKISYGQVRIAVETRDVTSLPY